MSNSTISGNEARGGIPGGNSHSDVVNCSYAGSGGGIANLGVLRLDNVTVTDNQVGENEPSKEVCAPDGYEELPVVYFGGLYNMYGGLSESTASIRNSIIADNEGRDCGGDAITSLGNNLLRTTTGCTIHGEYLRWGAHLGPLQENGGSTLTHALGPKSPAIDAGSCLNSVGITVTVDQRGVARPLGEGCDIGAYESPYTSTFAIITTSLALIGYQPAPCIEVVTPCNLTNDRKAYGPPTWSPDGKYIAYTHSDEGWSIYRMNSDGTGAILLVENGTHPLWSPDGSKIAFLRTGDDYITNLYVMDANGAQITNLTSSDHLDVRNTAWSPDGSMLLFENITNKDIAPQESEVYVMKADGSQQRKVVANGIIETNPWSPDGSKFVYSVLGAGTGTQIHTIHIDGSNHLVIESPGGYAYAPVWSPNGDWIAYMCMSEAMSQICTIKSDGSQGRKLTQGEAEGHEPVLWSPDGTMLLFQRVEHNPRNHMSLAIIPATGGEAIQLTQDELLGYSIEPRWSPDGSKVAFSRSSLISSDIFVVGVAAEE